MSLERPGLPIYAFQGHLEDDQNPPDQPTDIGKFGVSFSEIVADIRKVLRRLVVL